MKNGRRYGYLSTGLVLMAMADILFLLIKFRPYSLPAFLSSYDWLIDLFVIGLSGYALIRWAFGYQDRSLIVTALFWLNVFFCHKVISREPGLGFPGLFAALPIALWFVLGTLSIIVLLLSLNRNKTTFLL